MDCLCNSGDSKERGHRLPLGLPARILDVPAQRSGPTIVRWWRSMRCEGTECVRNFRSRAGGWPVEEFRRAPSSQVATGNVASEKRRRP